MIKQNVLRGKILVFLREMYPEGSDERTIVSVFYQYHRVDDITDSLAYLSDKNYVAKKELPHPYKKNETISLYKILPSGIDLLDGNIQSDVGITVAPEDK